MIKVITPLKVGVVVLLAATAFGVGLTLILALTVLPLIPVFWKLYPG